MVIVLWTIVVIVHCSKMDSLLYDYTRNASLLTILIAAGTKVNNIEKYRSSILQFVALNGHTKIAELLIDRGVDVSIPGIGDMTALHSAAVKSHAEIVQLLINNIRSPKIINAVNIHGKTALHLAAEKGHIKVVKLLIDKSAEIDCLSVTINAADKHGNTPLYYAIKNKHIEIVKLLIADSDINVVNNDGETILDIAIRNGYTEIIAVIKTFQ